MSVRDGVVGQLVVEKIVRRGVVMGDCVKENYDMQCSWKSLLPENERLIKNVATAQEITGQ